MSGWLRFVKGAGILALCFSGECLADAEPEAVLGYSFLVVAWYEDIAPKPMELTYRYLQDCEEGRERVLLKLSEDKKKDDKFGYAVTECEARVEK